MSSESCQVFTLQTMEISLIFSNLRRRALGWTSWFNVGARAKPAKASVLEFLHYVGEWLLIKTGVSVRA